MGEVRPIRPGLRAVNYNLLLDWVSERATGSWSDFREAHDWLSLEGVGSYRPKAATTALVLASLGHMEMDWARDTWAATPPAITILPSAGAHALFVGSRSRTLVRSMDHIAEEDGRIFLFTHQQEGPDALFVAVRDEVVVEELAARLGIHYEFSVADRLSRVLPSLDGVLVTARDLTPARGYGVRRLAIDASGRLQWPEVEADRSPGLYSYDVWGREEFRWVDGSGRYLKVDKFTGTYAELRRLRRVEQLKLRLDTSTGELTVPADAPLPALQARAAVMCSGLVPAFDRRDRTRSYVNVPRSIAERIAESLGQHLSVEGSSPARSTEPRPVPYLQLGTVSGPRRPVPKARTWPRRGVSGR